MNPSSLSTDIFCTVIDNYGDIGVCWRLARQLAQRGTAPVRLWVDDLHRFAKIQAGVDPSLSTQGLHGVEIMRWCEPVADVLPHQLVIEAFGCEIPSSFISAMQKQHSLWINLEYLSAEPWTEQWHGSPSLQPGGLNKLFFFPGFTAESGGLLREPDLLETRDAWRARPRQRWEQLRALGASEQALVSLMNGARQVFMFCYEHAPLEALTQCLEQQSRASVLIVPQTVAAFFPAYRRERLPVIEVPFVDQAQFDRLLWGSDLNFVRGEDSLVRAIWAGKPLIWHIYRQQEQAHLVKLDAWLDRVPGNSCLSPVTHAWNSGDGHTFFQLLDVALQPEPWLKLQHAAHNRANSLATQCDLVTRLLALADEHMTKALK